MSNATNNAALETLTEMINAYVESDNFPGYVIAGDISSMVIPKHRKHITAALINANLVRATMPLNGRNRVRVWVRK